MKDGAKAQDPWTDPDPQPGDFDAELEKIDPTRIKVQEGVPGAKVRIISEALAAELRRGAWA